MEEQAVAEGGGTRSAGVVVLGVCQRSVMSRSEGRDGRPRADGEQHVETRSSRWVAER
jgi:hypothetical protein